MPVTASFALAASRNAAFSIFFQGEIPMIALLFALLAIATVLAWKERPYMAYAVFAITLALSIYWLKFHSTTILKVVL
jgi:Family of unknown function (DUF5993)